MRLLPPPTGLVLYHNPVVLPSVPRISFQMPLRVSRLAVVLFGVGLAALRNPSFAWMYFIPCLAVGLVLSSVIGSIAR